MTIAPSLRFTSRLCLLGLVALVVSGCSRLSAPLPTTARTGPDSSISAAGSVRWSDVSETAGVRFQHVTGASGRKFMPETMGSGGAFLDFDGDGWLDLFIVNSRPLPGAPPSSTALPLLLRNRGDSTFADATKGSGLDRPLYGMGCAAADYDADGRVDLFISTCLDGPRLYRNRGSGRFEDVTARMGLTDRRWGTSCAWLDYDRDGWVDLFVCRYLRYRLGKSDRSCFGPDGQRMYCNPKSLSPETCVLYRNDRGRRFVDVSAATGIAAHPGKALGVAVCDLEDDGWPDLYVANDTEPNFLFRNVPGSTGRRFQEIAMEAGAAVPESGEPRAGMGIDVADIANDGRLAIGVSNLSGEGLALYHQDAPRARSFTERGFEVGLGPESLNLLGFGLLFLDFDNDTRPDLFVANGHIQPEVNRRSSELTYAERKLLFRNVGAGRFVEVGRAHGPPFTTERVGRGAACGDYDNDGDLDLLVVNNGGPAELLRNEGGNNFHWLQIHLIGNPPNTGALGARVTVRSGEVVQRRMVRTGSSYLSQSMTRLHFGLGTNAQVDRLEVVWPDGAVTRRQNAAADRLLTLRHPRLPSREPVRD